MKTLLVILTLALMSGCSTASMRDYKRGIAAEDQMENDAAACAMEAKKYSNNVGGLWGLNAHLQYNEMFDLCMHSKGYRK